MALVVLVLVLVLVLVPMVCSVVPGQWRAVVGEKKGVPIRQQIKVPNSGPSSLIRMIDDWGERSKKRRKRKYKAKISRVGEGEKGRWVRAGQATFLNEDRAPVDSRRCVILQ